MFMNRPRYFRRAQVFGDEGEFGYLRNPSLTGGPLIVRLTSFERFLI